MNIRDPFLLLNTNNFKELNRVPRGGLILAQQQQFGPLMNISDVFTDMEFTFNFTIVLIRFRRDSEQIFFFFFSFFTNNRSDFANRSQFGEIVDEMTHVVLQDQFLNKIKLKIKKDNNKKNCEMVFDFLNNIKEIIIIIINIIYMIYTMTKIIIYI